MLNTFKLFVIALCLSHGIPAVLPAASRPLAYEIGGMSLAVIFLMLTGEFIIRCFWDSTKFWSRFSRMVDSVLGFYVGIFDEVLPGERARWKADLHLLDERHSIYRRLLMSEADKTRYGFVMLVNMIFASGLMLQFFTGIMVYMQREIGADIDTSDLRFSGMLILFACVYGFILFVRFNRSMDLKYRAAYEARFEEVTIDNTTFIRERGTAAAGA